MADGIKDHSKLGIVYLFHVVELAREIGIRKHYLPKANESPQGRQIVFEHDVLTPLLQDPALGLQNQCTFFRSHQAQRLRSRVRYWMASLRCAGWIEWDSSKSAIVRETFRMRS